MATETTAFAQPARGEEERARADVYSLIAALLGRPADERMLLLLRTLDTGGATGTQMAPVWDLLRQAAHDARAEEVADEYQELFIGIGRGELVPYGSWYLTGFLMERPLAELRTDLARLGFERDENVREPEDHVAALCETMSLLIAGEDVPFEAQREFHEKHVAPWMGRFFNDLAQARSARFYRAVGLLGEQFMKLERAYFAMAV
ncbi:TorD/DmsD family molecular chaperone [Sulfurifustis variabilis]|nr:molecular chaperone TorD family protein [Sulfurifustis variabilis]